MREEIDFQAAKFSSSGEVQRLISGLLPSSVVCIAADPSALPAVLHPAEEQYVREAVPKRRREFAAGRACARAALERFGVRDAVLPRRADRTPLWVQGFVGSITHCAGAVAAAVARTSDVESLGIDIEEAEPLPATLRTMIAGERERAQIARLTFPAPIDWFKLLFSAKESFFKCHFMVARRMLDFEDVEIAIDPQRGEFVGWLTAPGAAADDLSRLHGRFCVGRHHVFTAVVLHSGRGQQAAHVRSGHEPERDDRHGDARDQERRSDGSTADLPEHSVQEE
jgi:4'-phosphopantetheinyl transferase EntD